jgi:hypothetical protein
LETKDPQVASRTYLDATIPLLGLRTILFK